VNDPFIKFIQEDEEGGVNDPVVQKQASRFLLSPLVSLLVHALTFAFTLLLSSLDFSCAPQHCRCCHLVLFDSTIG